MDQELYVIIDKRTGKVARKASGGHSTIGTFVNQKMAENNFWRYVPYGDSHDNYKIVKYKPIPEANKEIE